MSHIFALPFPSQSWFAAPSANVSSTESFSPSLSKPRWWLANPQIHSSCIGQPSNKTEKEWQFSSIFPKRRLRDGVRRQVMGWASPSLAEAEAAGEHLPAHPPGPHLRALFCFLLFLKLIAEFQILLLSLGYSPTVLTHTHFSMAHEASEGKAQQLCWQPEPRIEITGRALKWGCAERGCPVSSYF